MKLEELLEEYIESNQTDVSPDDDVVELTTSVLMSLSIASLCMERLERVLEMVDEDYKEDQIKIMKRLLKKFPELKGVYKIKDGQIINKLKNYPEDLGELLIKALGAISKAMITIEFNDD